MLYKTNCHKCLELVTGFLSLEKSIVLDQSPISLSAHTLALEVTLVIAAPLLYLTLLSAVMVRIKRMFCVHFNLRNFHFLEYKIGIYDRAIIPLFF